jgi:tRNA U34 5-methylaminomethyl-2-thiouridine-forming methyltransferase MnmC
MHPPDQSAVIDWAGEVPVSTRFGDPYYAATDGLAETRHVYLAGNGLPERLRAGFHVAELGFGVGLNLLALAASWAGPGTIRYTGFEAFPVSPAAMARALAAFPALAGLAEALVAQWRGGGPIRLPGVEAQVIAGDARVTLPLWQGQADAWFLDGFAPARNPELWEPALLAEVARHTTPGGSFATYSAAGHVRRGLQDAGFAVTRCQGFGAKRHMSRGVLQ